jgi:hypothetical protein
VAGVTERKAEALHRRGSGFAKHLGVKAGTERWNRIVYGTKRSGGWHASREKRHTGIREVAGRMKNRKR